MTGKTNHMKKSLFLAVILVANFATVAPVYADKYTVRQIGGKSGECYNNNKRVSSARFCHNCRKSGGNRVVWRFRVFCEGRPTSKTLRADLTCKKSVPKEGDQLRELYSNAEDIMEENLHYFAEYRDCRLDGWPE